MSEKTQAGFVERLQKVARIGLIVWITSQIGAREHYAVPRALQNDGRLQTLFTDFWAGPMVRDLARKIPQGSLQSLAGRWHEDLGKAESGKRKAEIVSWNWRALAWEAERIFDSKFKIQNSKSNQRYLGFIEVGQKFSRAVRARLHRGTLIHTSDIFFGYDTGSLETLEYLKERGVRCVVDQMDPNRLEMEVVCEEDKRWPGWINNSTYVPEEYFQRREQEWALADRVVVNSEFSRQALIRQGVPCHKLVVIPLCYESDVRIARPEARLPISYRRPLKVLFLGQVILRKGIQYLIEAAKLLQDEPVHFDIVGPVGISEEAVKSAPSNVTVHGRVNREQTAAWYQQADIFVLPTLSDGFALTQLEAMAHGLPVITTPNCGEVVTDKVDGFVSAARDVNALAKVIQKYLCEPGLLSAHGLGAQKKIRHFTLAQLRDNLAALESEMLPQN